MRVAFVHDWLNGMRGGENCLEELCRLFPEAQVYTLLHERGRLSAFLETRPIHGSFVEHLPAVWRRYRYYLPIFPLAIESLPVAGYDVVVSLSHCVAKGVRVRGPAPHLCYCLTPMRYAWDLEDTYFGPGRAGAFTRLVARVVLPYLRRWDRRTALRVDRFVGISDHVRERIRRVYGRRSALVYPPVDTAFFQPREDDGPPGEGPFLMVTALAPYKGVDLAIEAVRGTAHRLRVIGSGQDEDRLRAAAGPEVEFLSGVSREELRRHYAEARAFLHPAEEDFGIAPVEAQAMGTPVLGLDRGGLTETVVDLDRGGAAGPPTGILFPEASPEALRAALDRFEGERDRFDRAAIRRHAARFSRERFQQAFLDRLAELVGEEALADARSRVGAPAPGRYEPGSLASAEAASC